MRCRRLATGGALLGSLVLSSLLLAAPARADVQFGSNCTPTEDGSQFTIISVGHGAGSPLPVEAPISGIITRWTVDLGTVAPGEQSSLALQLYRESPDEAGSYTLLRQTPLAVVGPGANTIAARLPVVAGDLLGVTGHPTVPVCDTKDPADVLALGDHVSEGSTLPFTEVKGFQVPLAASIEVDADADGYGDETQDRCPQRTFVQGACPPLIVDAAALLRRRAAVVLVTTDSAAPVTVTATVGLGKGRRLTLSAAPQPVPTGTFARFRLPFPKALRSRLLDMRPRRALTLRIAATATNPIGQVSEDRLKAKLRGQDRSKP